jgi:hypothetical protein
MTRLKASDESTWTTLNEIVAETRTRLVGSFGE